MYDRERTLSLMKSAKEGDKDALSEIVSGNMGLVKSVALRFCGRGCETEDLFQIGSIGLIKAVRGFDESYGTAFSTFAVPHIIGEIRRFLRDDGIIKVSRDVKRNSYILLRAKDEYEKSHSQSPSVKELCEITGIEFEDAVLALDAASPPVSLNESISQSDDNSKTLESLIGEDPIEKITENIALSEAIKSLDEIERQIISLRYFKGLTQAKTAEILNMNQVKISRAEKKIMEKLKGLLSSA